MGIAKGAEIALVALGATLARDGAVLLGYAVHGRAVLTLRGTGAEILPDADDQHGDKREAE